MPQESWRKLTEEEERVIVGKGTERPFSGKYDRHREPGVYACRQVLAGRGLSSGLLLQEGVRALLPRAGEPLRVNTCHSRMPYLRIRRCR